jgi:hypothetical protein
MERSHLLSANFFVGNKCRRYIAQLDIIKLWNTFPYFAITVAITYPAVIKACVPRMVMTFIPNAGMSW